MMAADVQREILGREYEREIADEYTRTRDPRLEDRLVRAHLRLVVRLARSYRVPDRDLPDLIQEGNLGLVLAVRKFDPRKGVKLSTYAAWWIRAYQLRFLLENHRLVKVGTTQAQRKVFFGLRKAQAKLTNGTTTPNTSDVAAELGVSTEEVKEMESRLASCEVSMESARSEDRPPPEFSSGQSPEEDLAHAEVHSIVRQEMGQFQNELEGRERTIFDQRWMADDQPTLKRLGDFFGVSRERTRQLESRLLQRLKPRLAARLGAQAA